MAESWARETWKKYIQVTLECLTTQQILYITIMMRSGIKRDFRMFDILQQYKPWVNVVTFLGDQPLNYLNQSVTTHQVQQWVLKSEMMIPSWRDQSAKCRQYQMLAAHRNQFPENLGLSIPKTQKMWMQ